MSRSSPRHRDGAGAADRPFASVDDLWGRVRVPVAAPSRIAEADGFRPSLGLARRQALWLLKGLLDEELPLFAAASDRAGETIPGGQAAIALRPMAGGREVVKDYGHTGLSLRRHPVAFLRDDLTRRRMTSCAEAMATRDRRWLTAAGIVLVRQRPGSAKGVMFITLEDETRIANLIVWPKVFEAYRRIILSAGMIAVQGRVQREGEVVHLVAHRVADLSRDLASVGSAPPHSRWRTARRRKAGRPAHRRSAHRTPQGADAARHLYPRPAYRPHHVRTRDSR